MRAYVFEPDGDSYRLITDIALARNPIIVSDHKTNGWKDLIMFVAGGGTLPGYYKVIKADPWAAGPAPYALST